MAANLDLFRIYLHRQPNADTKLDLRSPIVDRGTVRGLASKEMNVWFY